MKDKQYWLKFLLSCFICFLLVGCASSKYIERKQYLLEVPEFPTLKKNSLKCSVFLDQVAVVPPFDQLGFLYRLHTDHYLTDYYHGFLVSPAEQLNEIIESYLKRYGHFNVDATGIRASKYRLEVKLTELYADYRNRCNPEGVVSMRFILTKLDNNNNVVLLDEVLRSNLSLKEKNNESLLQAWNKGIEHIVKQATLIVNRQLKC